jgi:hypothetical protein
MSYLRYMGIQNILCCAFVLFFFVLLLRPMLSVSLDCPFLIAASILSIVYFPIISKRFSMLD